MISKPTNAGHESAECEYNGQAFASICSTVTSMLNVVVKTLIVYFLSTSFALAAGSSCIQFYQGAYRVVPQNIQTYLVDTINSLERMRGKSSLVRDIMWVQSTTHVKPLNEYTSGTNIAVDILVNTELMNYSQHAEKAKTNLTQVLSSLKEMDRHSSGLFFSWYSAENVKIIGNRNLSSIDNLHLAISLWTVAEKFPELPIGKMARELFERMDFSMFVDNISGLIGGNFTYFNGVWVRDTYNFSYLGSEARILYTAGWALGIFKEYANRPDIIEKGIKWLVTETRSTEDGLLLRLWDGSAFQLYFPKMFVGEENYSPVLKKIYRAMGSHMISEGQRRGLAVPAAHSPGVTKIVIFGNGDVVPVYTDKAGNKDLVSAINKDINNPYYEANWDMTFTPYALFMAATTAPDYFIPIIKQIQTMTHNGRAIYLDQMGWMDGMSLAKDSTDAIVPAQIAVNQGMVALSLLQMSSSDGLSASGRALLQNQDVQKNLKYLYQLIDQKLVSKESR